MLFIGPYDLSTSMGIPGQVHDPAVQEAIAKVLEVCQEVGKIPGIFGIAPDVCPDTLIWGSPWWGSEWTLCFCRRRRRRRSKEFDHEPETHSGL